MKKYIVGGFVRDRLMGLKPKDKDYVLVGAKPRDIDYLKSIGFEQVGKDFPVYLSPEGHEHALARTERKVGDGYGGFAVDTEGVTLEQDLFRRDFTMNAIAYDPVLKIHIDPYNGKDDLKNGIIRHVSSHFAEDPLRILRLARFSTRYSDFSIHPDTDTLARDMVSKGDINHLTKERVYVEFEKAFTEQEPVRFVKYLRDIGALSIILPEFKGTKEQFRQIESISENSTEAYKSEFIWTVLLEDSVIVDNSVGLLKLPSRFVKFYEYISRHKEQLMKFRRSSVEDMVNTLSEMSIKNKGGEEFLYKVLEYLVIRKEIDLDHEDLIIKVYDRFDHAPIGDIEQMLRDGELSPKDIQEHIRTIRTDEVRKMF